MARVKTKVTQNETDPQAGVCKYKTAAAEERAMMRRLRTYRAKLEKEMEGMTNQEKADYMNRLGREARMGVAELGK